MTLLESVKQRGTLLLDGSTGTQLMARGLTSSECPELWNAEKPDKVSQIAKVYYDAGSDVVMTNTFGASKIKLAAYGMADRSYELTLAGAKIALSQKPAGRYILGSVGPSGDFMEPLGEITESEMVAAFADQIRAFADAKVDGIMLETFTDINEMKSAIKAVKANSSLPFLCSMTFDKNPRGYFTNMGVSVEQAIDELSEDSPLAIGSNCGNGIDNMVEILERMRKHSAELMIFGKPNAGLPQLKDGKSVYSESVDFFKDHFQRMLAVKPSFIGGCCGTTEEHIRAMRVFLDSNKR